MRIRSTKNAQLGAWLIAGMSAPLAQFAGGMTWQTAAVAALMCLGACYLVGQFGTAPGKTLCVVQYIWLIIVLSQMIRWTTASWSMRNRYPAVPLILLALGAALAWRGTESAARAGSVVYWLVALIYSVILVAGAGQVDLAELCKVSPELDFRFVVVVLLPALAIHLPQCGKKMPIRSTVGILILVILFSAMITGKLSLKVAAEAEMPFHAWVEGLRVVGTLQRFEAVASVALTMGWFALLSFILCVAGQLAERINEKGYGKGVWWTAASAGALMLTGGRMDPGIIAVGCAVLWVTVPLLASIVYRNKK